MGCLIYFMYIQVALPGTGYKTYTYIVPENLQSSKDKSSLIGRLVMVPFRNYSAVGAVLEYTNKPALPDSRLKKISGLIDSAYTLPANHLTLIKWLADYYICPIGDVLKAAYPPGVLGRARMRVCAGDRIPDDSKWQFVYGKIKSHRNGYIYSHAKQIISGISNSLIKEMIKTGILFLSADYKTSKPKTAAKVSLKAGFDYTSSASKLTLRRKELIDVLSSSPECTAMSKLTAMGFSRSIIDALTNEGFIEITREYDGAIALPELQNPEQVKLNTAQQKAAEAIIDSLQNNNGSTFLLYGVTGSGKTQVYIKAAKEAIAAGKSVLILLPEISLTPQAIARFSASVECPIGLWHSRITAGQRADVYRRVKSGELKVVLGVRSAVFVPLNNLGLIVIDEEQDDSFKQSEPPPRYNARDVALMRAKIEGATTVLGSATPSMESFCNAQAGKYQLLRLPERYGGGKLPTAYAVDLKNVDVEYKYWPLSETFIERLCMNIADEKQVIILLNRRGYSSILMCRACGYIALCPNCKVAMTYHKKGRLVRCHFCGYAASAPEICPNCKGTSFDYQGIGTQKLEELLIELLGEKGIIRMDSDTTAHKGAIEKIITTFEIGDKPILMGTKMVAKGHHFPQVGMVGVVLADAGLHVPDFRASEKVFQLLVQAAGRAGRTANSDDRGEFVVQTYDPSSGILGFIADQNYEKFYSNELLFRRELSYPPFGKIIRLVFSGKDESFTRWAAKKSAKEFAANLKTGKVLGPAPTGVFRLGNKYHYQLVLKGRFSADFKKKLKDFVISGHPGKDKGVLLKIDVDPREMT
ncbi:MAG: primosomal protein N' [candidate division Zixibacteria bacterium]|nr:primosomal protein N' [candidate division Zixibacteria bacterium]